MKRSSDNGNTWDKVCLTIPDYNPVTVSEFYSSYFLNPNLGFFGVSGRLLRYTTPLSTDNFDAGGDECRLFPNPSSDTLRFSCNLFIDEPFEIYTSTGVPVGSGSTGSASSIDVSVYPAGLYFALFPKGGKAFKFIKE